MSTLPRREKTVRRLRRLRRFAFDLAGRVGDTNERARSGAGNNPQITRFRRFAFDLAGRMDASTGRAHRGAAKQSADYTDYADSELILRGKWATRTNGRIAALESNPPITPITPIPI
jgi:hypothetical protein